MVNDVVKYESGEMTFQEIVVFFQGLIDAGLVWKLQGHYCRTAKTLIEDGYCFNRRIFH